jgi:hypothetical protein
LDAKLATLLAFLVTLVGLGSSALICLAGSLLPNDLTSGPDPVRYYRDYGGLTTEE